MSLLNICTSQNLWKHFPFICFVLLYSIFLHLKEKKSSKILSISKYEYLKILAQNQHTFLKVTISGENVCIKNGNITEAKN